MLIVYVYKVLASGINDMANADSVDWDYPSQLQDIIAEYTLQIQRLYDAGGERQSAIRDTILC